MQRFEKSVVLFIFATLKQEIAPKYSMSTTTLQGETAEELRESIVNTYLSNERVFVDHEALVNRYLDKALELGKNLDGVSPLFEELSDKLEIHASTNWNKEELNSLISPLKNLLQSGFRLLAAYKRCEFYPAIKSQVQQYESYIRDVQELKEDIEFKRDDNKSIDDLLGVIAAQS